MTARGLALCLFGLTMVAVHGHARAQEETAPSSRETATRIDPAFAFMATVMESFGPKATVFGVGAGTTSTVNPAGAGALLRFTRVLELHELIELQAAGVRFPGETSKTVPRMGTIYRAWLPWHALEVLETHPLLVRAEATWKPRPLPPLEVTSAIVGAAEIRRLPNLDLDGKGVVIGSIDSGIDVFHPAFFHADGEHYDWIDVNGNGRFEPGVDAVDLNRNGQADRNETLRVLDATVVTSFDGPEIENADGILQVNRDWLYADMNHDGRRNAGRQAGFFEDDPAYGEPIFVVDDVNGNGQLDVGEKLIRLKTSKIRKYYEGDRVFERGVDLIEAVESEHFRGAYHGTGVAGILVGGQPGHHDRVGLAPGAELIVYGYGLYMDWEATIHTHYLERAVDDGVDILLHEWTNPVMRPLDGSTNLEAAMDHLYSEEDIIQINPVGNLNTSDKHTMVTGSPGEELRLGFVVEDGFSVGADLRPITTVYASLQWRGDHLPRLFVATPMDDRIELFLDDPELVEVPGGYVRMLYERTSRGTHMATFYLFTAAEDLSLPAGVWNLIVDQIEEEEIFFGRIGDQHTIWRGGVVWRQGSRDVSTLSFPATADSAFGVSAFGGRRALEVSDALPPGSLRAYAGRGPRLDGSPSVNLAAPDDPYVPLAATSLIREAGGDYGWFAPFGGTSGAAPHVAASLALLK
ncbi:MAG: S8 family serine peptidase, partial [Bradymonadaceae bacterium]